MNTTEYDQNAQDDYFDNIDLLNELDAIEADQFDLQDLELERQHWQLSSLDSLI